MAESFSPLPPHLRYCIPSYRFLSARYAIVPLTPFFSFSVQPSVPMIKQNVHGNGHQIDHIKHKHIGQASPQKLAGDPEQIARPNKIAEAHALPLGCLRPQGLCDGNRPRYPEADHHQHLKKFSHPITCLSLPALANAGF